MGLFFIGVFIVKVVTIGNSVDGKAIEAFIFGDGEATIHFYGGFHGDEPEGVDLAWQLRNYLAKHEHLWEGKRLIVVANCNPDGFKNKTRVNANGVDLNRNFPTKDWTAKAAEKKYFPGTSAGSEPEVKAIVGLIKRYPPQKIISFHSLIPHQLNYDGPGEALAKAMAGKNSYPVTENIGYPTPGSLGSYAGKERKTPIITYELPEKITPENAWKSSLDAILEAINY